MTLPEHNARVRAAITLANALQDHPDADAAWLADALDLLDVDAPTAYAVWPWPRHGYAEDLLALHQRAAAIADAHPADRGDLERVGDALDALIAASWTPPTPPVHPVRPPAPPATTPPPPVA